MADCLGDRIVIRYFILQLVQESVFRLQRGLGSSDMAGEAVGVGDSPVRGVGLRFPESGQGITSSGMSMDRKMRIIQGNRSLQLLDIGTCSTCKFRKVLALTSFRAAVCSSEKYQMKVPVC